MNFDRFKSAGIATIAGISAFQARKRPNRIALSYGGQETSYQEFDRLANRVANGILALGTHPESRIAVLDRSSNYFFEVCFGAAKARAVLVPVNFRLALPELQFVLSDAEAEIL